MPAFAQEADQQMRQQIEAVHMKWLEALNKGDVDAFSTTYTPATVQIDAFGRTVGVNAEFVQGVHKKGIVLSLPIDGVQALKGGQAAIATARSRRSSPIPMCRRGRAMGFRYSSARATAGRSWRTHRRVRRSLLR